MLLSAGLEDKVPVRAAEEPRFLSSSVLWLKPESLGRLLSSSRSTQLFCQLLSEVLLLWRLSMREHRAALQIQSLKHHHLRYPGFRENLPTNFSDTTYRYSLRSRERKKRQKGRKDAWKRTADVRHWIFTVVYPKHSPAPQRVRRCCLHSLPGFSRLFCTQFPWWSSCIMITGAKINHVIALFPSNFRWKRLSASLYKIRGRRHCWIPHWMQYLSCKQGLTE